MFDEHLVPNLGSNMGKTIGGLGLDGLPVLPVLDCALRMSGVGLP